MDYISKILPSLLNGSIVTLQVFFVVLVLSIPLGAILAFLMQVQFKPLQWLLTIYIWIMRGTPLLLQLIFLYYVLPSVGISFERMPAAIIAFTLNYAAYY
ncbi:ABC transporter permease subunit, partial [Aerococcaceae bacterium NML191292]|nr:ABC transporter permease subunit [Aerococcaceae bacterium NML191292]